MNNDQLKKVQKLLIGVLIFLTAVIIICVSVVFWGGREQVAEREEPATEEMSEQGLSDITTFLPDYLVLYDAMPELQFEDAEGNQLSLADFAGKPLVITFWASWCPDCHEQMTIVNECAALAEQNGCTYILMDKLDSEKETKEQALAYLEENAIEPVTYFDQDTQIYKMLGMHNVPTTLFIDENGILKSMYGKQITKASVFEAYLKNTVSGSEAATEAFVTTKLSEDGGIHTTYDPASKKNTLNSDVLSESQGLLLEYAVLKKNQSLFDTTLGYVEAEMWKKGLTAWQVSGGKPGHVNALIDDFRIYEAMAQAEQLWGGYAEKLEQYRTRLAQYAMADGSYIDFYDSTSKKTATRFTLCYADFSAMELLAEQDDAFQDAYRQAVKIVEGGRISDEFPLYYSWYNYKTAAYEETDLNMSEAMMTLFYLSQVDRLPEDTVKWLKDTLNNGGIMARYDVSGNVVAGYHYESTATYALLVMIGENIGDAALTGKALNKMEKMRINDTEQIYNGAFGNSDGTGIYSFDQLVPMLAYAYCAEAQNVVE